MPLLETPPINETPTAENDGAIGWTRPALGVILLIILTCTAFSTAASAVLLLAHFSGTASLPGDTPMKLLIKCAGFLMVTLITGGALAWMRSQLTLPEAKPPEPLPPNSQRTALTLALVLVGLLIWPNLVGYPFPEPDETHHLVVARNLAAYGIYGSGHPEFGFIWFDPYDSVGPAVLGPIAAMFSATGASLLAARLVMSLFFLLLCVEVYWFVRPVFGEGPALVAIPLVATALGSVYLARTVYGEVPALLFLLLALHLWRNSLAKRWHGLALAAGVLFGLAVLSKFIILLTLWPILAALFFDRLTAKRAGLPHVVLPVAGLCLVVGAWMLVERFAAPPGNPGSGVLDTYQHYLMFGLGPLGHALGWVIRAPLIHLALLAGLVWSARFVYRKNADPATVAAYLAVPFFLYWWFFFTPVNIPRYSWYSLALGSILIAVPVWHAGRSYFAASNNLRRRVVSLLAILVICAPSAGQAIEQVSWVYTHDDTKDLFALADYVIALPEDTEVATTWWPLERSLNFLTGRWIPLLRDARFDTGQPDVLLMHQRAIADTPPPRGYVTAETFGTYVVATKKD